ncbi:GNAT family N-acetyltransferase [Antrihabitans sp. YC3-6]|uniref:GNAT family N-acetyltransferase n=1 Tax=Antrihabitans stalagmiti TaxID=2799499 RepID=A0A934NS38_9NOCA|nr:GNAT family N-acetyltransferase [Antrihabitans stalagmiti]MBJ8340451.1 GNAT family N-acetyltransferase [Antrihabitans stalagmiti]
MAPSKSELIKLIAEASQLGPQVINGRSVVLRLLRVSDAAQWRRIRLRDREFNEPYAPSSPLEWEVRHSPEEWVRRCLALRKGQKAGRSVPFAIEVDGIFAGECAITWSEIGTPVGELSVWLDSHVARGGVAKLATAMLADFGFDVLGMDVITAATGTANLPATRASEALGMKHEATMDEFFDAGGERKPYNFWTLLRADKPEGGFAKRAIDRVKPAAPTEAVEVDSSGGPSAFAVARYTAKFNYELLAHSVLQKIQRSPKVARGPKATAAGNVSLRNVRKSDSGVLSAIAPDSDPELALAIEVDGNLVGQTWLRLISGLSAEFGLATDSAATNIEKAGAELMVDYAFEVGCERIWALVVVGDERMRRLVEHLGMVHEGTLTQYRAVGGIRKDHELWAITKTRYSNTRTT